MENKLIYGIVDARNLFKLNKVKIFVNEECNAHSLFTAYALQAYLKQALKFDATVVLSRKNWDHLFRDAEDPELPEEIELDQNDFVAVLLDCNGQFDAENMAWNNSYLIFEVTAGRKQKIFGVNAYNDNGAQCAAEIVYHSIKTYSLNYKKNCEKAYGYLYLAIMSYTEEFQHHLKTGMFAMLQDLSRQKINLEYFNYLYKKNNIRDLKTLQAIYGNCQVLQRIGWTKFKKEEKMFETPFDNFRKAMEYLRYVDNVDLWVTMIEQEDGKTTEIILQGNTFTSPDFKDLVLVYKGNMIQKRLGHFLVKNKDLKKTILQIQKLLEVKEKESLQMGNPVFA